IAPDAAALGPAVGGTEADDGVEIDLDAADATGLIADDPSSDDGDAGIEFDFNGGEGADAEEASTQSAPETPVEAVTIDRAAEVADPVEDIEAVAVDEFEALEELDEPDALAEIEQTEDMVEAASSEALPPPPLVESPTP